MTYVLRNGVELETELANLNMRLGKLEGVEPMTTRKVCDALEANRGKQPRTPRLVEVVERLSEEWVANNFNVSPETVRIVTESLAAEKKRQELRDAVVIASQTLAPFVEKLIEAYQRRCFNSDPSFTIERHEHAFFVYGEAFLEEWQRMTIALKALDAYEKGEAQ